MNSATLAAVDADAAALASASSSAEEALTLHRDALAVLTDGWESRSGCAAIDLIRRQCGDAAELVAALQGAAADFRSLRDVLEGAGSVPGFSGRPDEDPGYAQTAARLNERPQSTFEAPVSPPAYAGAVPAAAMPAAAMPAAAQPAAPQPPAWPLGAASVPLPNVGGALVGLVAQIADALIPDDALVNGNGNGNDAEPPQSDNPADEVAEPTRRAGTVPRVDAVTAEPTPPVSLAAPVIPATSPSPTPVLTEEYSPPASPPPAPEPPLLAAVPEPPLLAAERPPESEVPPPAPVPAAPAPVPAPAADLRTPCEIAADELPQVGQ